MGTAISPTHSYTTPGVFTVSVDITSPIGCKTDTTFQDLITIRPAPTAGFSFTPAEPTNINPEVSFFDESQGQVAQWQWDFSTGATSSSPNPVYSFPDTGSYAVSQVVIHPNGCVDTLTRIIDVAPEIRYWLPNAFTPNGDASNDTFRGEGFLVGMTDFNMTIWNRWGEMIFQTANPEDGWNGRKFNQGEASPMGVYVVVVTFRGPRGKRYEVKGFATLIR